MSADAPAGGFEAALSWPNGTLARATVESRRSGNMVVRYGTSILTLSLKSGGTKLLFARCNDHPRR